MRRGLLLALVTGCLSSAALLIASPAVAADITIDYPQTGDTAVSKTISASPPIEAVTLAGTFASSPDDPGTIVAYIDGRLDSCEDYFGDDPFAEANCHHVGTSRGSDWTFQITRDQIERLGFDYYGEHTVEIRLLHRDGETVTGEADTVTFTVAKEARSPAATAEPPGTSAPHPMERSVSRLSGGSPSAPSVLSATPAAQELELSAARVALTALVTVIPHGEVSDIVYAIGSADAAKAIDLVPVIRQIIESAVILD